MEQEPALSALLGEILGAGRGARAAYERFYRKAYGIVRHCGVPTDPAKDVVSEVVLKLLKGGGAPGGQNPDGYLYRMFRNAAMDWHRANRDRKRVDVPDDQDDPEAREECLRKALAAFAEQSEERAMVLRLTYLEGWAQAQIAEHIGRSYGATREFLSQTRTKFRAVLLEMCADFFEGWAGVT